MRFPGGSSFAARRRFSRKRAREVRARALSQPSSEQALLLAEYALDFAMQAASRALLISLEAIDAQMTEQEEARNAQ